jgi:hypothetical protein
MKTAALIILWILAMFFASVSRETGSWVYFFACFADMALSVCLMSVFFRRLT